MSKNRRVQVQMEVAVDVIHRQAGGAKFFKLRFDLTAQLRFGMRAKEIAEADSSGVVVGKFALRVGKIGNGFGRQSGSSTDKREVQADTQSRIFFGQGDSFGAIRFVDHQAGGGQDAFAMRADHGLIDGMGATEIVRVDDETGHGGP